MATSIDTWNNVGPKTRYRLIQGNERQAPVDIFLTPSFAANIGADNLEIIATELTPVTQSVRAHTRRQYPGDNTTISVSAHERIRAVGGNAFNSTLPGKSAYFGVVREGPPRDQKEIQFQFTGSYRNLVFTWQLLLDIPVVEGEVFYLRTPNGVPKKLADLTPD